MLTISNAKLASIIYRCERLLVDGAEELEKRKLKAGHTDVNQGIGGLKVVREILESSVEVKSVSFNYNQEAR